MHNLEGGSTPPYSPFKSNRIMKKFSEWPPLAAILLGIGISEILWHAWLAYDEGGLFLLIGYVVVIGIVSTLLYILINALTKR